MLLTLQLRKFFVVVNLVHVYIIYIYNYTYYVNFILDSCFYICCSVHRVGASIARSITQNNKLDSTCTFHITIKLYSRLAGKHEFGRGPGHLKIIFSLATRQVIEYLTSVSELSHIIVEL